MRNYASVIVRKGVNVQQGQEVVITASVDDAYFVKYVIEEAYKAGAKYVTVDWSFQEKSKLDYNYASVDALAEMPEWAIKKLEHRVNTLPAQIHIVSADPDGMKGVDQEKVMSVRKIVGPITRKYRDMMDNKFQWTIAGIPSDAWSKKVFPELEVEEAKKALWEAILKVSRIDDNSIQNWTDHNKNMHDKCQTLNDLDLESLHYTNAKGTDFTVGLISGVVFEGGSSKTVSGVEYNPNIPTEECFTSPNKYSANGIVYSSKPLSVMGHLVDDFAFVFENGKIVEVKARNEEEKNMLEKLISLDEGARMLGEVALVPYSSPISLSGVLFYNTLYDENAACHLAIGAGFPDTIKGFDKMSEEEIKKFDLNESMIHVDFMIGTKDLDIVGTTRTGKQVQIFKDGNWSI